MENVIPLAVGRCGGGVFIWNADFPKSAWRLAETLFPSCFDALPSERPEHQNPVRTTLFQRGLLAGLRCGTGRRLVLLRPLSLAYDCVLAAMDEHKGVLRVSRTRSFSVLPCPAMFHKGGNLLSIFSPHPTHSSSRRTRLHALWFWATGIGTDSHSFIFFWRCPRRSNITRFGIQWFGR